MIAHTERCERHDRPRETEEKKSSLWCVPRRATNIVDGSTCTKCALRYVRLYSDVCVCVCIHAHTLALCTSTHMWLRTVMCWRAFFFQLSWNTGTSFPCYKRGCSDYTLQTIQKYTYSYSLTICNATIMSVDGVQLAVIEFTWIFKEILSTDTHFTVKTYKKFDRDFLSPLVVQVQPWKDKDLAIGLFSLPLLYTLLCYLLPL